MYNIRVDSIHWILSLLLLLKSIGKSNQTTERKCQIFLRWFIGDGITNQNSVTEIIFGTF